MFFVNAVCRELSINGSASQGSIASKVHRFCDFGTIRLPGEQSMISPKNVPVLPILPVLAAKSGFFH